MTSSRGRAALLALLVALGGAATPATVHAAPSNADLETARDLFKQARQLRADGDVHGALAKFKAAHALGNTPITALELARTHAMLGELVDAREVALSVARMPVQADETERSASARIEAAQLAEATRARIASLRITVLGAEPGETTHVTVDGAAIPPAAMSEPRKVDPGSHEVRATSARGRGGVASVTIGEGETREVSIFLSPTAIALPTAAATSTAPLGTTLGAAHSSTPARRSEHPGQTLAIGGFITGGLGLGLGLVTGGVALGLATDLKNKCPNNECGPSAHDELRAARVVGTVSSVAFGVAVAGLAIGFYGAFLPESERTTARVQPIVGPGSLGLRGSF